LKLDQWVRILIFLEESLHRNPDKSDVCKQEARCQVSVNDVIGDGALLGPSEDSMMATASLKIPWMPIRSVSYWRFHAYARQWGVPVACSMVRQETGDHDGNIEAKIGSTALQWWT
jgi:hypothetical protein